MDKVLSIQTIKNVFAALGAKTSDDNYGVALLDKTTAEPKGLMGMSDLASVLGVSNFEYRNIGDASKINDISKLGRKNSIYYLFSADSPSGVEGTCLTLYMYKGDMYVQFFFPFTGGLLFRTYNWSDNVWTTWKTITLT